MTAVVFQTLSSPRTRAIKIRFPLVTGTVVAVVAAWSLAGNYAKDPLVSSFVVVVLAIVWATSVWSSDLRKLADGVEDHDSFLRILRGKTIEDVPFSNISGLTTVSALGISTVGLTFTKPTMFGRQIAFIPQELSESSVPPADAMLALLRERLSAAVRI
jgi:hypothetical protein